MADAHAGRLRHIVTFEQRQIVIDSNGEQTEDWVGCLSGATFSAEVMPLSGRELIAAGERMSRVSARIRMRYMPNIDPAWRVLHSSTVYNIDAIILDPDTGNRWMTLQVYTGTNDG